VSPGGEATTTLTVRNETDIVEAYTLEVVGDSVAWTTVEPARVSLYPGTSETVTIRVAPPRSSEVRAGEHPLGIKVLPSERPELVRVPETTVTVEAFRELRGQLDPRRRRGWLRARYLTAVQNLGNDVADVALTASEAGDELRFGFSPETVRLEPGESREIRLAARARKLIWFGKSVTRPFEVKVAQAADQAGTATGDAAERRPVRADRTGRGEALPGEFVQLAVLPKWLLWLLAVLAALVIAWFALVRPTVQSYAKQAANGAVQQAMVNPNTGNAGNTGRQGGGQGQQAGQGTQQGGGGGGGSSSNANSGLAVAGTGQQHSGTIDVQTGAGTQKTGVYEIPDGKVFGITDLVIANFQGDEGLVTIKFGDQTITTIPLESIRNQDFHWVTQIEVPAGQAVTADVTCRTPGTPANSQKASACHEILNVSGVLSDMKKQ
jgi:hypothetical protein